MRSFSQLEAQAAPILTPREEHRILTNWTSYFLSAASISTEPQPCSASVHGLSDWQWNAARSPESTHSQTALGLSTAKNSSGPPLNNSSSALAAGCGPQRNQLLNREPSIFQAYSEVRQYET